MAYKQKSDKTRAARKPKAGKTIYGIIGMGRFGLALAQELHAADADLIIVDKEEEKINLARELTENAFIVRNLEKKTLLDAGMGNCDVAVVGIGEHIDTSILTTLTLVSMGIPKVIAKATSTEHGLILEKLGADRVVIPEQEHAQRLARSMYSHNVLDYIELSEDYGILEVPAPKSWIGKCINELNVRAKLGVNIIAVENGDKTNVSPAADYRIQEGDVMVVLGDNYALSRVQKL